MTSSAQTRFDATMLDELETPFLTVDLDVVERNIGAMQRYCDEHGIALRVHVKTHKLPEIAGLQLRAGAIGIACQKLGEAELFVERGCGDDVLVTFPLIGRGKDERFAALAGGSRIAVGGDSARVAAFLSAALTARGTSAGFLVDCDTGFGRTGVATPAEAADLAELADRLPGLEFQGLMTHPTLPASGPWLREARGLIEQRGLEVGVVSVGGTPTAFRTHETEGVTELRAGTYVYGDRLTMAAGAMQLSDCALRIRSTVVSAPRRGRVALDAGSKALTSDPGPGADPATFGLLVEYPEAVIDGLSEEHGHVDTSGCDTSPEIGETVTIVPNHACATVNVHSEIALHRGGVAPSVIPVAARGLIR